MVFAWSYAGLTPDVIMIGSVLEGTFWYLFPTVNVSLTYLRGVHDIAWNLFSLSVFMYEKDTFWGTEFVVDLKLFETGDDGII